MAEAKPKRGIPDWLVKLTLGCAAIGVGGYIAYEVLIAPRKYWEKEYEKWFEEYVKEYKQYVEQTGGALTAEQENVLNSKLEKMREAEKNLMSVTGQLWDKVVYPIVITVCIAIILKYFPYQKVAEAIKFYRQNAPNAKSAEGVAALTRCTINVAYAEMGNISLATAAQTSTEMWATTMLYPTMEATVSLLTAQLPTLTGIQLAIAQYLITALQIQMSITIPSTLAAAASIITALPPIIPLSPEKVRYNRHETHTSIIEV
jgi:uncharacterized membrane protein (DUF106 family)